MELAEMYLYLERWRAVIKQLDSGISNRDELLKILELKIFNMKTICELSDINYDVFRASKGCDFANMSDDRVNRILKTIYTIVKYY